MRVEASEAFCFIVHSPVLWVIIRYHKVFDNCTDAIANHFIPEARLECIIDYFVYVNQALEGKAAYMAENYNKTKHLIRSK